MHSSKFLSYTQSRVQMAENKIQNKEERGGKGGRGRVKKGGREDTDFLCTFLVIYSDQV